MAARLTTVQLITDTDDKLQPLSNLSVSLELYTTNTR